MPVESSGNQPQLSGSLKARFLTSSLAKKLVVFFDRSVSKSPGNEPEMRTTPEEENSSEAPPELRTRTSKRANIKRHLKPVDNPGKIKLRNEILALSKEDSIKFEAWIKDLNSKLPMVAQELENEGIEATMDLKLDRLFQNYTFNSDDLDLLIKLKKLGLKKIEVIHLAGKISQGIAEDIGTQSTSTANKLATRDKKYEAEALKTRVQYLSEADTSDLGKHKIKSILPKLLGRPYGLREDLKLLNQHISEMTDQESSQKSKISILKKQD